MERSIVTGKERAAVGSWRSAAERGFTLLELMISMFIMIILLSVALPTYQRSVQHARETVLKENLWQMRKAIDQYAADKSKLPKTIDDLVTAKYLRDRPVDPITETD
jgi:general secretion pathway protein G